jgi:multiple sugar transport system substrate-binding protein
MDEHEDDLALGTESEPTRRTFLKGAAATGLALAAAGSLPLRAVQAASTQNLVYWNLFGGGDGVRMVQMEKDFAKANPSISVKSTTLAWGTPYYTKLTTSTVAGKAPDIGILHMTRLPAYAPAGLLTPLDAGMLAKFGITKDKFLPDIWAKGQYNGQTYAIPLDTHPFVMYYNLDICKKAGLLDASGKLKPIVGPDAMLAALKAVQKVTGKYGLALDSGDVMPWRLFYSLYTQLGGKVISADAKSVVLDNAKATKALSFMAELTSQKLAPSNAQYPDAVSLFSSGKAGFHWNGEWEATTFQSAKMNFDMQKFPNIFGSFACQADSHSFVVPHQRNMSSDRLTAILTFISFMLKDSVTWAQGGHIPAYLPIATGSAYKNLSPQSHYADAAKYVTYDPTAWWSGSASQMEVDASSYFQAILLGKATPAHAIGQFHDDLQKLINTPAPS